MLIAVVGPSGAGKDALIAGAKAALRDDPRFVFPLREITKPPGATGEPFVAVDEATFARRAKSGAYCLWWRAHGYGYGVPVSVERDAKAGKRVVANLSRSVLGDLRARFADRRIVLVTASRAIVEDRLKVRGRESAAEIVERLARYDAYAVAGDDVVEVRNERSLEDARAAFLAAVTA